MKSNKKITLFVALAFIFLFFYQMVTITPSSTFNRIDRTPQMNAASSSTILINEVWTLTDWVELVNLGPPQDMTGWTIYFWYGSTQYTYNFPAGFMLNTHAFVQVNEMTGINDADDLYIGYNLPWTSSDPGAVAITNNMGTVIDHVQFNGWSGTPLPGTQWSGSFNSGSNDDKYRSSLSDTDTANDWSFASTATSKALNPGQIFPELPFTDIKIKNIVQTPLIPYATDNVKINASIESQINILTARIYLQINTSAFIYNEMNLIEGSYKNGIWQGNILEQPVGTNVTYYLYVEDNSTYSEKAGPFSYIVQEIKDYTPPELINLTRYPLQPTPSDPVSINVSLKDSSGVKNAQLIYRINSTQSPSWQFIEETNFNTPFAASNITIIDNETLQLNSTGHYPAAYSFTADPNGGNPAGWTVTEPGTSYINVIAEKAGKKKVVENYQTANDTCYLENTFTSKAATAGHQIEFWLWGDSNAQTAIEVGNGGYGMSSKIWIIVNFYTGQCYNVISGGGGSVNITTNMTSNVWHHFRLRITGSLTYQLWIDKNYYGVYNGWFSQGNFDRIRFHRFMHVGPYYFYIDAVDYSWSTGYYLNRNYQSLYYPSGFYQSKAYDLGVSANYYYQTLNFSKKLNLATDITLEYRISPNNSIWSDWSDGSISNISIYAIKERYLQFRINFTSSGSYNNTPMCFWVRLDYIVNQMEYYTINLNLVKGNNYEGIWNGSIPAFDYGTCVRYYLDVSDEVDNRVFFPEGSPNNYYGYCVGINDNKAPPINFVSYNPQSPAYNESIALATSVNMSSEVSGIKNVTLCYSINHQNLLYKIMNIVGGLYPFLNFSTVLLPSFSFDDVIYFNITSCDFADNFFSTSTFNFTIGDKTPPALNISFSPTQPNLSQNVQVIVHAHEIRGAGIKNPTLCYEVNESALIKIESPHPVPNMYNFTWTILIPQCAKMQLFFENISLENNFDYLYVYNGTNAIEQQFTGLYKNINFTIWGNTTRIRLITDFACESWGFYLSQIKFYYLSRLIPMSLSSGDISDGDWTATIPKQGNMSQITFKCTAFDFANNSVISQIINYNSAERNPPNILEVIKNPSIAYIKPASSPVVTITVSDNYGLYPNRVILQYSTGGPWINRSTTSNFLTVYTLNGVWTGSIPALPEATTVNYRIVAYDCANNLRISQNSSYYIDGTAPKLAIFSRNPLEPQYNDTISLKLTLTDVYTLTNGAGIDSVTMVYYNSRNYLLESPHPYENSFNQNWTITYPSSLGIAIYFSRITLSAGDFIRIYDANGVLLQSFTGSVTNQWSLRTYTESIKIQLITDTSGTNYGFFINQIRTYYNTSLSKISGTIYDGLWTTFIPPNALSTTVWYDVTANDRAGNSALVLSGSFKISDRYQPEIVSFEITNLNPKPTEDVNLILITRDPGSGIKNVTLWLSFDGGITSLQVPFANLSNTWTVTIPRQSENTHVKYWIQIYDNSGNLLRNPQAGFYSLQFVSGGDNAWLLIVIIGISVAADIVLLLYLRNRLKLKSIKVPQQIKSKKEHLYE